MFKYLFLSFLLVTGCKSNIRTNVPNFRLAINKYTYPSVDEDNFNTVLIKKNKITKCIFYKVKQNGKIDSFELVKSWVLNFDKNGIKKSKEFFKDAVLAISEHKNNFKTVIIKDTSYWIRNKHYVELETNSERIFHIMEYKIKNTIGTVIYDSTFIVNGNNNSNYYVVKYDLINNIVNINSNGKNLKKVFTFRKNKIVKIDYQLKNSRSIKKDLFKYNSKGDLSEVLYAFNSSVYNENTLIKKYFYNDLGLISSIKQYNVLDGDIELFYKNKLDVAYLNNMTVKYEWIKN